MVLLQDVIRGKDKVIKGQEMFGELFGKFFPTMHVNLKVKNCATPLFNENTHDRNYHKSLLVLNVSNLRCNDNSDVLVVKELPRH